ncbi:MAG: response regulator [Planctomycetota bacterium]
MSPLRAPGVRAQFVLMTVLVLVITSVVTVIHIPQYQSDMLEEELEQRVADLGLFASERCAAALVANDHEAPEAIVRHLALDRSVVGAQLFDPDGGVVTRAGEGLHLKVRPRWLEWDHTEIIRNDARMVVVHPVVANSQRLGTLLVLGDRKLHAARLAEERRVVLGVLALSLACGLVVSLAFGSLLARRLTRLRGAAERVAGGDFDLSIPTRADDELGQLTRVFNRMVEQLRRTTTSRDALSREVQERRRAYDRIRALKEKAEEAARIKSEFLANMSHEIRTPMNGVIGMTELALDTDLTDEQQEYLTLVRSSAESLLAIIDDILDFSKIEAGRLSLDPVELSLCELVGVPLRTLAVKAHEKGLSLIATIDPEVPTVVVVDPVRLRQVLVNLIGNAIKFTESGEIVLHIGVESLDGMSATLHFSVQDTGIGIPTERQQAIFDAFSQADGSTTRKYGGTGLGLSISAQLVELMRGMLWVESETERGSTFHFTVECGLIGDPPGMGDGGFARDTKIGLVVQNAVERGMLVRLFESWGGALSPIVDPHEVATALEADPKLLDVLFVDAHMQELDGLEYISEVQQRTAFSGAIILAKHSGSLAFVSAHARQFGLSATINKPLLPDELQSALVTALAAPQVEGEDGSDAADETHGEPLKILLAEDNEVNQKLAVRMLEKRGHSVTAVPDGAKALAAATSERFDLILMDVQMPEMGGLEATREIRDHEIDHGGHVPIVAMTANTQAEDRLACLECGMDGYVPKPVKAAVLFGEIERAIAATADLA